MALIKDIMHKISGLPTLLILCGFGFAIHAYGAEFRLHSNDAADEYYHRSIKMIGPGDRVGFSNGLWFTVEKVLHKEKPLASHGWTAVFAISNDRAIKLPMHLMADEQLRFFLEGYKALKQAGVPTVHIYLRDSYIDQFFAEYVMVERVAVVQLLSEWFNEIDESGFVDQHKKSELENFLYSTYKFEAIGDFRPDQLAWTGKKWILLDWDNGHIPLQSSFTGRPGTVINQLQFGIENRDFLKFLQSVDDHIQSMRESENCENALGQVRL